MSRDDVARMLQSEFHVAELHMMFSLDGTEMSLDL
jgi:hypothetical protein